jgi:hypothetical protein
MAIMKRGLVLYMDNWQHLNILFLADLFIIDQNKEISNVIPSPKTFREEQLKSLYYLNNQWAILLYKNESTGRLDIIFIH